MAVEEKRLHQLAFKDYKFSPAKRGEGKGCVSKRRQSKKNATVVAPTLAESTRADPPRAPQALPRRKPHHPTAKQYSAAVPHDTTGLSLSLASLHVASPADWDCRAPPPPHDAGNPPRLERTYLPSNPGHHLRQNPQHIQPWGNHPLEVQFGPLPQIRPFPTVDAMHIPTDLFNAGPRPHSHLPYSTPSYELPQHPAVGSIAPSHMYPHIRTIDPPPLNISHNHYQGSFGTPVACPSNGSIFGENPQLSTGPPTGPFAHDIGHEDVSLTQEFDPLSVRGSRRKAIGEPHLVMESLCANSITSGPWFDFGSNWYVLNSPASLAKY